MKMTRTTLVEQDSVRLTFDITNRDYMEALNKIGPTDTAVFRALSNGHSIVETLMAMQLLAEALEDA